MQLNYLAFAIPFFLLFMALEYWVAKKKEVSYFSLHDTVANISVGITERLLDVFTTGVFFYLYDYLQKQYGLFQIRASLLLWLLLLICTDFLWYWYHRLAHEINIFWAVHVVHHQSEDFNYTVSARITVFQAFVRTLFWSALPVIGFPAGMITSILLVHGFYPFFIHTRLIGKMGILEYIFVTPSHHRVHHARNAKYLDKNYGDLFIIWDKLFGTFQEEEPGEEIVYGLTRQLKSHSFLWQHFHFFIELLFAAKENERWLNKIKIFFGRPKLISPSAREHAEKKFQVHKRDIPIGKPLNRYVIWQIICTLSSLFVFILFEKNIPIVQQVLISCLILITLVNCGAIMEQKTWIVYLEFSRLLLGGLSLVILSPTTWLIILIVGLIYMIYYYSKFLGSHYLRLVYARES